MSVWVGVVAALGAGMAFALAGVLQQRAASDAPAEESLSPRLLLDLARNRVWLTGIGAAVVSYALQAVALAFAPLALVQPLIVTELLFAIPVSARLRRIRLSRREWTAVLAVAAGLAIGLWAANPTGGDNNTDRADWLAAVGLVGVLAGTLILIGRRQQASLRASAYAAAAATVLGMQSGLLDQTVHLFADRGASGALSSWVPYAMAVAALTGTLLVQSAFQAGPLAVTLPVIDIVEPLSASAIGVFLLGEQVNGDIGHLSVVALAMAVSVGGIAALDTSPAVHALRDAQRGDPGPAALATRSARRCAGALPGTPGCPPDPVGTAGRGDLGDGVDPHWPHPARG